MSLKEINQLILKKIFKTLTIILAFILCINLSAIPSYAAKTSMTGDYAKDTVAVVKTLKDAVETPRDALNSSEVRDEALALITDYISRYRNRGMVIRLNHLQLCKLH